jgi:hypothetical protein
MFECPFDGEVHNMRDDCPSISDVSKHMAELVVQVKGLGDGITEIKASLLRLAEGQTTSREFEARANALFEASAKDRNDLWAKVNDTRDRELKDLREKVEDAKAHAATANGRAANLYTWLRIVCVAYGLALLAMFTELGYLAREKRGP